MLFLPGIEVGEEEWTFCLVISPVASLKDLLVVTVGSWRELVNQEKHVLIFWFSLQRHVRETPSQDSTWCPDGLPW